MTMMMVMHHFKMNSHTRSPSTILYCVGLRRRRARGIFWKKRPPEQFIILKKRRRCSRAFRPAKRVALLCRARKWRHFLGHSKNARMMRFMPFNFIAPLGITLWLVPVMCAFMNAGFIREREMIRKPFDLRTSLSVLLKSSDENLNCQFFGLPSVLFSTNASVMMGKIHQIKYPKFSLWK
jgi:hypothetical protein